MGQCSQGFCDEEIGTQETATKKSKQKEVSFMNRRVIQNITTKINMENMQHLSLCLLLTVKDIQL